MSRNGITESLPSYFEELPTETIWMIASLCNHKTIAALAATSSHIRLKVLLRIHRKIRLTGHQNSLEGQLNDFLEHHTPIKPRVCSTSTIRSATISVFEKPEENIIWAGLYAGANSRPTLLETRRTLPISEVLQAMPNLRSLSLHLKFLDPLQELELYDGMQKAGDTEVQYLRIDSSMRVMEKLLGSCPALTTLDIDHAVTLEQLQNIPPSVKRLAVTLHLDTNNSMVWIPSLCVENIRHIVRLNSGLEELILRDSEKNFSPFDRSAIEDGRGLDELFKDTFYEAVEELSQLPNLKQLAICVWKSVPLQILNHTQRFLLNKHEWYKDWYQDCLRRLGEALPHLQRICILCDFPYFWQGTRRMPEGTLFTQEIMKGDRQTFPGTFERYSLELELPMAQW
ncbi:unnamed protein product [Clonostachys rhizophaga]|uniref:Uncharacterized protein n=1 Tax=Clonostachys rhizophaga TaxID=160324 RepID=A0A9N9VRJ4_9HYPO|nr:unnamed protein product [Clonostachys rhizophaga]